MSIADFFGKRPRSEDETANANASTAPDAEPTVLCCWNANSLLNRLKSDAALVKAFLEERRPDILFVSEVRMAAAAPPGAKRGDGKPRRRGEPSRTTPEQSKEADLVFSFLRAQGYKAWWSLSDSKYSGAALLVRRGCTPPDKIHFSLDTAAPASAHHPEGRVIGCSFPSFDLLGTYSPNNGTTEESFAKRRQWDAAVEDYLVRRTSSSASKPQVWVGDLNVAPTWECVGPDASWFREKNGQEAKDPDDRGQPGFTPNEQRRFNAMLARTGLVDAYRIIHPQPDWRRDVTWRGTAGKDGVPEAGRYFGKGMRIDFVLCSQSLAPRVSDALVYGHGPERSGFLGSDHCPLIVRLGPPPADGVTHEAPAGGSSGSGSSISANEGSKGPHTSADADRATP